MHWEAEARVVPGIMRLSEASPTTLPGYSRTFVEGRLTLGLSPVTDDGDLDRQVRLTRTAEEAGFAAVWARDIPLNVETFGDVGQIHDPFIYLTWLAAHTSTIALGTAAVVLPLAHPLLLAWRSAGLGRISGGRFVMGVATGDRPEEFTAFGMDKGERRVVYRLGRHALLELLESQRTLGLNHVILSLRQSRRPVEDALAELAEYVVPELPA